ncbi:MAG: hypothetical protein ACM3PW_09235 [Chlamydiota bacterium]
MIHIDRVRISFANYRGPAQAAEKIARRAMEHLEEMAGPEFERRKGFRMIDRALVEPVRLAGEINEEVVARTVARRCLTMLEEI